MKSANISDTRNKLSVFLKMVKSGASVAIRERNKVIAYLVPASDREKLGTSLGELVDANVVRPPLMPLSVEFLQSLQKLPKIKCNVEEALLVNRRDDR